MNTNIYYNSQDLRSRNALFNFVIGERGNGKTFDFKKYCIDSYAKKKKQFIWTRRYETEFDDIDLFFTDLHNDKDFYEKYKDVEFSAKGGKFYYNKEVMGYYIPLSKQLTKKSTPYPNVDKIVFDEFIITKNNYHYLPKEVINFFEFYSTISRLRDIKVYFISNAISWNNPYFVALDIQIEGKRFTKKGKDILVELTDTPDYREKVKETRFYNIIKGTGYERYAVNNEFLLDNHSFIEKRGEKARNVFNLKINKTILGIWFDYEKGKIYVSKKYDSSMATYCIYTDDMQPNYYLLNSRINNMKQLKSAIQYGYIYYEDFATKSLFSEVLKFLNMK